MFFQSKCTLCVNASQIEAHASGSADTVSCPVGGEVKVAAGCSSFAPSDKATCSTCWNFSGEETDAKSCSVHGILAALREACPEAVERASA